MNDWLPHKKPALLNSNLRKSGHIQPLGLAALRDSQRNTQTYRRNTCIIIKSMKINSPSLLLRSADDIHLTEEAKASATFPDPSFIFNNIHITYDFFQGRKNREGQRTGIFLKKHCFYLWLIMRKRWIQLCFPSSLSGNWSKCDFWRPKLHKGLLKVVPERFCFYNCTDFISF